MAREDLHAYECAEEFLTAHGISGTVEMHLPSETRVDFEFIIPGELTPEQYIAVDEFVAGLREEGYGVYFASRVTILHPIMLGGVPV